jgi:hypothetical protein
MTDIHFIHEYYTAIIDRLIIAGFKVNKLLLVRSESELVLDIKEIPAGEFFLAVVIPSTDTRAENIDNVKEVEPWLIYLLEKTDRKAITQANRLTSVANQQQILRRIKEFMRTDMGDGTIPCNIRPDLNSMHSDPEENFIGCEGYSLSFKVISDDFFTSNQ